MSKKIYLHILFWVVFTALFTFTEGGYKSQFEAAFYIELSFLPFRIFVVYLNYFLFLPNMLLKGRYYSYGIYTILSIIVASFGHRFIVYEYVNPMLYPTWDQGGGFWQLYRFIQSGLIIFIPMMFLLGLTVITEWVSTKIKAEHLEKAHLKTELSYLRAQINPHFFFNTLNNLYGLALKKSNKTPEVVMKLSELMNYVLYEADQERIFLSKEIEQIERYIALEQIRYQGRFEIDMKLNGDIDQVSIPPLLLLPFVENSFKHGVNKSSKDGQISILVNVTDDVLTFVIKNRVWECEPLVERDHPGLGIDNVRKRLNLLFPAQHTLTFEQNNNEFAVNLTINYSG